MKTKIRLFIRDNELSDTMSAVYLKFQTLRDAIRYCSNAYPNLGKTRIRQGLFYGHDYKQVMVEKSLAAKDTIAMIVIE